MELAKSVATWSKDSSTRVGCVLVGRDRRILSIGFNGIPRKVQDLDSRLERPAKYMWTAHAEINAIANAASNGVALYGCTAYVTCFPCAQCTAALINAGAARVVSPGEDKQGTKMPTETFAIAREMMKEAGVQADTV